MWKVEVVPILTHLVFTVMLHDMCYVVNAISTKRRWPFAVLNSDFRIQKWEFLHVAFAITFICKLLTGRWSRQMQWQSPRSQTVICSLRNRGCISKTLSGCKRQCHWMFELFVKWHAVSVLPQPKMWAQNFSKEDMDKLKWRYQYSCSVGCYCPLTEHERTWFALPATYVKQTWSKVHDMEKKEGSTKSFSHTRCHHGLSKQSPEKHKVPSMH
jgi:hypothetical protein